MEGMVIGPEPLDSDASPVKRCLWLAGAGCVRSDRAIAGLSSRVRCAANVDAQRHRNKDARKGVGRATWSRVFFRLVVHPAVHPCDSAWHLPREPPARREGLRAHNLFPFSRHDQGERLSRNISWRTRADDRNVVRARTGISNCHSRCFCGDDRFRLPWFRASSPLTGYLEGKVPRAHLGRGRAPLARLKTDHPRLGYP
jgi:hypothetical protein